MDPIPENSIVFNGFGKDIGDTLSLLKFEFEELEKNKVALQKVEVSITLHFVITNVELPALVPID